MTTSATRRRRSPGRTWTPRRRSSSWSAGRRTRRSSSAGRSRRCGPREEAEIALAHAEERLRAEGAHLRTEQQLGVQKENLAREVAVAEKNRERVIAIETERIEKDR